MSYYYLRQCVCGMRLYSYIKRCPYCLTKFKAPKTALNVEPVQQYVVIAPNSPDEGVDRIDRAKKALRSELLALRDSMTIEDVREKSISVVERLLQNDRFKECGTILCYAAFRNEVQTAELIKTLLEQGKTVAVPQISHDETGNLAIRAVRIKDYEADLRPGTYGIPEPVTETVSEGSGSGNDQLDPGSLDAVIIPGVAFDRSKNRLGFGKGYFDRYLSLVRPECFKIGLAYTFQVLDSIPCGTHDTRADIVITDEYVVLQEGG